MHIILGATGHIGSALTALLLANGESVTAVSHDEEKARSLKRLGAKIAVVDIHDVVALRRVFGAGKRLFLLNPPAAPSTDTVQEEKKSVHAILAALDGSGLEKIVAESVYGAQPGEGIGDLGVLYEMEQALRAGPIPTSIIRGAYYMSNWDQSLATAKEKGEVPTLYPVDFTLPMVAPKDIAKVAARLLQEPVEKTGLHLVEGPHRYSSADVAKAFSKALGKPIRAVETPPSAWKDALHGMGFSPRAAESFIEMTKLTLNGPLPDPSNVIRGETTLDEYVDGLVSPRR